MKSCAACVVCVPSDFEMRTDADETRLPSLPARLARTPKASTPVLESERLTLADVAAVLAAVRGERIESAVLFSVAAGLRQGELLGLRYEDVDLAKRILTVRNSVERGSSYRRLSRPKGGRERVLALSASALHALDLERSLQERDRALYADGWRDLGLVFAGPGGDIQPSTLPGHRLKGLRAERGLCRPGRPFTIEA